MPHVRPSVRGQIMIFFEYFSLSEQWISGLIEQKAIVGFAYLFRPTYAGANVGHPRPVVDQILL